MLYGHNLGNINGLILFPHYYCRFQKSQRHLNQRKETQYEENFNQILAFLSNKELNPERMLSAIKGEEIIAKSRIAALQARM